jgi:hypothetical protein
MSRVIEALAGDWRHLDARIEGLTGEIETLARRDQHCERLMTVPGIGSIISSAMVAAIGTGDVFSKGRDFGAWLGLVPKQISTGDRTILGSISRRGNRYLRALFVQAAWVVLVKLGPKQWERYGLMSWIEGGEEATTPQRARHCAGPQARPHRVGGSQQRARSSCGTTVVMMPKMILRTRAFRKRLISISSPAVNTSNSLPRSPRNCTIGWFTGATSELYEAEEAAVNEMGRRPEVLVALVLIRILVWADQIAVGVVRAPVVVVVVVVAVCAIGADCSGCGRGADIPAAPVSSIPTRSTPSCPAQRGARHGPTRDRTISITEASSIGETSAVSAASEAAAPYACSPEAATPYACGSETTATKPAAPEATATEASAPETTATASTTAESQGIIRSQGPANEHDGCENSKSTTKHGISSSGSLCPLPFPPRCPEKSAASWLPLTMKSSRREYARDLIWINGLQI